MPTDFTHGSTNSLPEQLAASAGAGELAAAAAIDAEEGDKFLHSLLADQMAAAHLVTMRLAAVADRAIGAAAEGAGRGDGNLPLYDLAAARFSGAAARLNGRYARGLQTLRALTEPQQAVAADDIEDIEWVGITLPAVGEDDEMTEQERARRINRAKSYLKLKQAALAPEPADARRPLKAGEKTQLARAASAAHSLVSETGVETLVAPSHAQHTKLFAHQLAAAHRLTMRLSGRADAVVMAAADPLDRPEGLRLAHGAARLMERFQQGVAILQRVRTGPDRPRRVETYWSGPFSEYELELQRRHDLANGIDPDTGIPVGAPTKSARIPASRMSANASSASASARTLLRRGRLNNGNPGGDFLAAPRCGARTRASCSCRQPAMANGRCRFHGGKSTGPRTEAGRARARTNRLVHGLRSAELIALAAAAAATHRHLGALLAAARRTNQSDRSDSRIHTRKLEQAKTETLAGHGVDRSDSNVAAGSATILPFTRPKPAQSSCRNRLPRVRS